MSMTKQGYLTPRQLARQLGLSVSAVKGYCHDGVLRFKRKSKNSYSLFVLKSARDDERLLKRLKAAGLKHQNIGSNRLAGFVSKKALGRIISRASTHYRAS